MLAKNCLLFESFGIYYKYHHAASFYAHLSIYRMAMYFFAFVWSCYDFGEEGLG